MHCRDYYLLVHLSLCTSLDRELILFHFPRLREKGKLFLQRLTVWLNKYAFRDQSSTYVKLYIPSFMKIQCCVMVLPLHINILSANLVFRLLSPPQTLSNPLPEVEEQNIPVYQIVTNSGSTGQDCKIKTDSSTISPEPKISIEPDIVQVQYTH